MRRKHSGSREIEVSLRHPNQRRSIRRYFKSRFIGHADPSIDLSPRHRTHSRRDSISSNRTPFYHVSSLMTLITSMKSTVHLAAASSDFDGSRSRTVAACERKAGARKLAGWNRRETVRFYKLPFDFFPMLDGPRSHVLVISRNAK